MLKLNSELNSRQHRSSFVELLAVHTPNMNFPVSTNHLVAGLRPFARFPFVTFLLLAALTLVPFRVQGAQGLRLTPGQTFQRSLSSINALKNLTSFTIDLRFGPFTEPDPPNYSTVIALDGVHFRWFLDPRTMNVLTAIDPIPDGGGSFSINLGDRTEFVMRIRRDYAVRQISVEIWNPDGSGYQLIGARTATSAEPFSINNISFGGALTSGDIGFLRVYQGVPPLNSAPPSGRSNGDLLNYEFEGNGIDSSGNEADLNIPASLSFAPSVLYNPVARHGNTRTLRAGHTQTLSGDQSFSPNDGTDLQYEWRQLAGPSQLAFSDRSAPNPAIRGLITGTYQIELRVVDGAGRENSTIATYGAVATDSKGVVILPENASEVLFSNQLILGQAPWTYFDERNVALADLFGGMQENEFRATWTDPQPGTISWAPNSTTIIGTGTTFRATFCNGGDTNTGGNKIMLPYTRPNGATGRRLVHVNGCPSDTELTVPANTTFGALNDVAYNKVDLITQARWTNGGTNVNYYDNVLGFYLLYYRTGQQKYLDYARNLADKWWTSPFIDEGYNCDINLGNCLAPRVISLAGMMARALDGKPEMWPGIRIYINNQIALLNLPFNVNAEMLGDLRENGYTLAFLALCAALDPDPTQAAICTSATETELARFQRLSRVAPNGSRYWTNPTYFDASWNSQFNTTVTVTNGSPVVTGVGTNFQATSCAPQGSFLHAFRSTNASSDAINGDTVKYLIRSIDSPTQLTLDRPYQGPSASNRGWQCGFLVGPGTQPFMMGIVATALAFAEKALLLRQRPSAAADARMMLEGATEWIRTEGYRPLARGLWYGRYYTNCEPIGENADAGCLGGNFINAREYAAEALNAFAQSRLGNPNPNWEIAGDTIFGALFGKNGGPFADNLYSNGIDDNGWYVTTRNPKYFGFFFGFGQASKWPAARLGGVKPLDPAAVAKLDFNLAAIPGAVRVRIEALRPNGKSVVVECTTSPCSVPVDPRQGDHRIDPVYILQDGSEVRPSAPFFITP